jgi:uncharacterized membrane protein
MLVCPITEGMVRQPSLIFGGGQFPLLALAANHQHWRTPAFWLMVAAAAVYVPRIIVFTREVNLPLNAYTESWDATRMPLDWAQTRDAWNDANIRGV